MSTLLNKPRYVIKLSTNGCNQKNPFYSRFSSNKICIEVHANAFVVLFLVQKVKNVISLIMV